MNVREAVRFLEKQLPDPRLGLPQELFFFVSRVTPLINIDLLIKDENGRVLLSWRDDPSAGVGWHLPGGIIRFKENLEIRIRKVCKEEIGTLLKFDPVPIAINQIICKNRTRGILYQFCIDVFSQVNMSLITKACQVTTPVILCGMSLAQETW